MRHGPDQERTPESFIGSVKTTGCLHFPSRAKPICTQFVGRLVPWLSPFAKPIESAMECLGSCKISLGAEPNYRSKERIRFRF